MHETLSAEGQPCRKTKNQKPASEDINKSWGTQLISSIKSYVTEWMDMTEDHIQDGPSFNTGQIIADCGDDGHDDIRNPIATTNRG